MMWEEDQTGDCRMAVRMADDGDWEGFTLWLSEYDPDTAGKELLDDLLFEARDLVRRGDLRGGLDRIRLFAFPKFHSEAECRADYNAAMGRILS